MEFFIIIYFCFRNAEKYFFLLLSLSFQAKIELRVMSRIYVDLAISFYGCVESLAANLSKRDMP